MKNSCTSAHVEAPCETCRNKIKDGNSNPLCLSCKWIYNKFTRAFEQKADLYTPLFEMKEELKPSEQFFDILDDTSYGIFHAPTSERLALQVLMEYLLEKDFSVTDPISNGQVYTYAVNTILTKHSRKYRRDKKKYRMKEKI